MLGEITMRCQNCGMDNLQGMRFCGSCGKVLAIPAVEPSEARTRQCVECGRAISWDAMACMYCGHNYLTKAKPGTEGFLVTGAVLTILAGILGFVILTLVADANRRLDTSSEVLLAVSYTCSVMGVMGGLAALKRKWFPIAVLGGACAIFTPAFFFAIPGLALIVRSATSFTDYDVGR